MAKKKNRLLAFREQARVDDREREGSVTLFGEAVPFRVTLGGLRHAAREGFNPAAALQRLTTQQARLFRIFYRAFPEETRQRLFTAMQQDRDQSAADVVRAVFLENAPDDPVERAMLEAEALEPVLEALAEARTVRAMEDRHALLLAGLWQEMPDITRADVEAFFPWGVLEKAWAEVDAVVLAYAGATADSANGRASDADEVEALLLGAEGDGPEAGADDAAYPT